MDNINNLPVEILEQIFTYLNLKERKSACAVCSLWHAVLRGVRFQRQCLVSLSRTFDQELSELETRVTQSFRNLSLIHWEEEYFDDDDDDDIDSHEQRENEEVIHLKYLFEPTPEANIRKLLFENGLDLETLELYSSFESCREILGDQLCQLENLRELALSFCQTEYASPDQSEWQIHHNQINTLKIDVLHSNKPYNVMLPNLTTLELLSNCRWSFHIIQAHCMQLQRFKVQFQDQETMDDLMSLSFPMLTHLQVRMYDDKDVQVRYARTRNKFADKEKEEHFVKSMPKLKSLWLESDLMLYRIGEALSKYGHRLEKLTLMDMQIDDAQLRTIETFPKLKTVIMHRTEILPSSQILPKVNMPHLVNLTLMDNKSDIVFNNGLVGLKSLKLTLCSRRCHKVLHKICNNLPNLEYLELFLYSKWRNTALRHLNKLTKLRLLRINACDMSKISWVHCPIVPNVQKVVFDKCSFLRTRTLRPLAVLFPGLTSVYLDRCYVTGSEDLISSNENRGVLDEGLEARRKCMEQLKSILPQCIVSLNETTLRWKYNK
ncbi:uncharacterized protein LOC129723449 [Wyeomyia smithii]|uniref:uncharacterized protein LOC129723449 n=1 Tax=Wyeomyia smithii TaxID=174621 RepID=UPI002467E215|nr:uncharacterized protein LOC129723449 [Wyeomyia smithii]